MLSDPIFNGFAISLIFGEIVATILSRFLIPILYFYLIGKRREQKLLINNNYFKLKIDFLSSKFWNNFFIKYFFNYATFFASKTLSSS